MFLFLSAQIWKNHQKYIIKTILEKGGRQAAPWLLGTACKTMVKQQLDKKYRRSNYSLPHILKSLVYFVNADGQPMPRMCQPTKWEKIKQQITEKVKKFKI